jgi:hypothetical protein
MLLHELLDEVATGDQPPSRLIADEVYAAGQRRRRNTTAARIGAAAVLVVALVAALVVFAPARGPDPAVAPADVLEIQAIGGYDIDELYAIVRSCLACEPELHTTSDGGRTWTSRGTLADVNLTGTHRTIHVSHAGTIGVFSDAAVDGALAWTLSTSNDRGRSFARVTPSDPVDAAPPEALVSCGYPPPGGRCDVDVYDLDAGIAAPLATQPDLAVLDVTRAPDGTIWALGRDDAERPAIVRSTDGGRTWSTHVFTGLTAVQPPLAEEVMAVDGTVVVRLTYAAAGNPARTSTVAFRLRDGDWQRLDTDALQPGGTAVGVSYLAADGTLVVQKITVDASITSPAFSPPTTPWSSGGPPWSSGPPAPPPSGGQAVAVPRTVQFWSCPPDGTGFRRIDPSTGLPSQQLSVVDRLPGGGYLAQSLADAWVSDDGRAWKRVVVR